MLGQQYAAILAQNDPFDLAQGVERYVRSLNGEQARFAIEAALPHMNESYRAEFSPLLDEANDERRKSALVAALKRNLRAISLFGPGFCQGVLTHVPGDRTVALGEEGYDFRRARPIAFGVVALILLLAGAAGEHVWSTARETAQTPVVLVTPPPQQMAPPQTVRRQAYKPPAVRGASAPVKRTADAVRTAAPTPAPTAAPRQAVAVAPAPAVLPPPPQRAATAPPVRRTPPPGQGERTVVAVQRTPSPTPEPTDVDVSDMPQAFTDATPLPRAEAPPTAQAPTRVEVATPTPGPNRSWTHRLVHTGVNLVNGTLTVIGISKKSKPSPSPSPAGPQP